MNCNHFTSYLCEKLTGRAAPSWINRAATIGVALPCVVPREWIDAPDHGKKPTLPPNTIYQLMSSSDPAHGELLDEDFADERSSMLRSGQSRQYEVPRGVTQNGDSAPGGISSSSAGNSDDGEGRYPRYSSRNYAPRLVKVKDTDSSGRTLPVAERAPLPRRIT